MSGAKEIKTKIASVKNTQKITNAMEMVAASKMRKAQDLMRSSRPYAVTMRQLIGHIAMGCLEYEHPYTKIRKVQRNGYIIISTDRGLCGGLNINLFKKILDEMKQQYDQKIEVNLALIGAKAAAFFAMYGSHIMAQVSGLKDNPTVSTLVGSVKAVLDAYDKGKLDQLYICYNKFINTMTQQPKIELLLPLPKLQDDVTPNSLWDYIYEPAPQGILDAIMVRYIESQVYQAVVENLASEQAARMVAMKSATDNAGDIIDNLELSYNKERQASITQELSEIIAGAAAV